MKITPLFDRVLVKQIEQENKTQSGFILSNIETGGIVMAKVISVGTGAIKANGEKGEMFVKSGDKVLCNKFALSFFKSDNEEIGILRQTDILGIISEGENSDE